MRLAVVYLDASLVVVDKPPNLLVHRNAWARADEPFVLQLVRAQLGQRVDLVHRLDRATSGVLALARTPEATRALTLAFAEQRVEKRYLAIVRGHPPDTWTVDRPLDGERGEQAAHTDFDTLARATVPEPVGRYPSARYALVRAWPRTGRRHQIRRHAAGAGHPIVGDVAHGDRHHNHAFAARFGANRLCLHAASIRLPHPEGGRLIQARSAPGDLFLGALAAWGLTPDPAWWSSTEEGQDEQVAAGSGERDRQVVVYPDAE